MRKMHMRWCSLLLALVMVVSLLPAPAFAEETQTYTKVTEADELTTGKYVLVTDTGYAPNKLDGSWVTAIQPTIADDGTITDPTEGVWTLTVDGASAKLTDVNGTSIAPNGGNNNGIKSGDYSWDVTFADGKFTFAGTGDDTVKLASNASSQNKFRAYKNSTINGSPGGYPCAFTLYKLTDSTGGETPVDPVDPVDPIDPIDPTPATAPVKEGDKVVIYNPANGKALSTEYSGFYNMGTDVMLTDGVLSGYTDADIWTVGANADGSFTFATSEGKKLSMGASYTSMPLDEVNPDWTIEAAATEGCYYIKNVDRGYYIEWYADMGNWNSYNNIGSNEALFAQAFYLVPEDGGETPVDPEPTPTGASYTLTDSIDEGDTVLMYNAASGTVLTSTASGYKLAGLAVTPVENVITTDDTTVPWVVSKNEYGEYIFTQGDKVLGMVKSGSYVNLSTNADDGYTTWSREHSTTPNVFYLLNTKMPASDYGRYYLEYYNGYTAYSVGSPSVDAYGISFYKLADSGSEEPEPEPTPTYSTIAEALAGENGTEFTVKGVVTLLDGKNIYLQDATGGICLRLSGSADGISLGDTIIGTGSKTVYNGLPQLESGTWEASEGLTLSAKATTIGALSNADICTYVKLTNVEVTEVYDNNGAYTAPNITVTDGENSIQLYKAVINKDADGNWEYEVGDKLDITAAVGCYNATLQLRNTVASEVKLHVEAETGKVTSADQLTSGYYVMVVSTGYAPSVLEGNWVLCAQPTISDDQVTDAKGAVWTLNVTGDTVTLTDSNGTPIAPMGGNNNGIQSGSYDWKWTFDESTQTFRFLGAGSDTVTLASNNNMDATYGGFNKFRAYKNTTVSGQNYPCDFTLYRVEGVMPDSGLPAEGSKVVIYNQNAEAVLAEQNDNTDSPAINKALATITDGVATEVENGGVVFIVEKNGDYYRFKNETYGYLCSNGTGNNAFYSKDFSEDGVSTEDADWLVRTCSGGVGGYEMESRTAKFNERYSQWMEYYSDSFKTYSMYNVTDYTIYSFFFYPVGEDVKVENGVVNDPKVVITSGNTVMKGQDYTLTFYLDDINPVGDRVIQIVDPKGSQYSFTHTEDGYSATIPAIVFDGHDSLELAVVVGSGPDRYLSRHTVTVVDEPSIGAVTPAANSQTGENKRPTISAEIVNAGENPSVTMTVNGSAVGAAYADGKLTYTPAADMADGRTTVVVTVKRADGKETSKTWSFTVGATTFQLYFGQLHSHTQYSDGSGTLESALNYVENLPESANVQFTAFTDHSNYFDGSKTSAGTANPEGALYDMSLASADSRKLWNEYNASVAAFNEKNAGSMVALAGFEMTWSGGPGHINTFNTPGIVSRNNSTLNNKTADAGMKAYYALLSQEEGADSISQFNHPGTTFGNFSDFAYWDPVIDSRIYMVEVGNGEGQIGAGGYYPSYEQYIMALDKGWHVAPTNNQDNHKGRWGNANDARDVILTDNFTEEGIYEAIRDLRMYATEDKNLQIGYTVNDLQMGSIISTEDLPEKLSFNVTVYDPDNSDSIAKVELVVNSGKVAHTWSNPAELAEGELSVTLDPAYSYYFVRVTQADGDLAVTAPVWVGENLKLGISSVECSTSTPVTDEELTLTTTLFNSERSAAAIKSVTYKVGSTVLAGTTAGAESVPASGTATVTFAYTPTVAKVTTITVTAVLTLDNEDYTFTKDIELDIADASKLVYIGIDASHYNEYVAGNYADSMGNFSNLAGEYGIRAVQLNTSEQLIAACSNEKYVALILTAPSRRLAAAQTALLTYTDDEITAIQAFNANGGTVIMAGWSDHYEYYPDAFTGGLPAEKHMAATQNAVLAALGSSLRISDDATYDDVYSKIDGCDPYRLYFNTYNFSNFLVNGVEVGEGDNAYNSLYTEKFSHYGGASIYTVDGTLPSTVSPVVFGHDSTYSKDADNDGLGGGSIPKYAYAEGDNRLMVMATEQLDGKGLIVVSGAAFMSNFEVQATIEDNGSEKNYSNYKICENLLAYLNPITVTPIAEVQAQSDEGVKYTIEGIVTSNASGYDADTAFFDCIYVQDDTAGINAFPVAGNYKIGDVVRITGTTSSYQGERQIAVTSIEKLGEATPVEAKAVTAAQLESKGYLGSLVTVEGTATKVEYANGLVQTIVVRDGSGKEARVFIDGYITTAKDVENVEVGCHVVATGLASYDNTFVLEDGTPFYQRIRIRNRADVVCSEEVYTRIAYPITLNTYGGTIHSGNVTSYYPGERVLLPTDVTREGFTFLGWYNAAGECVVAIEASESGPKNFYAHWQEIAAEPTETEPPFVDVSENDDWFYNDMKYVYENDLMIGTDTLHFSPDDLLDRAQMVTILFRMAGKPTGAAACSFADVQRGQWYTDAVDWAVANGIVKGYDNGLFGTDDPVTREQLATMLFRYAVYSGMDFVTLAEHLSSFADVDDVSPYAVPALNWAVGAGLIKGCDGNRLLPGNNATRAQVAAIIHRYLSALEG